MTLLGLQIVRDPLAQPVDGFSGIGPLDPISIQNDTEVGSDLEAVATHGFLEVVWLRLLGALLIQLPHDIARHGSESQALEPPNPLAVAPAKAPEL